VDRSSAEGRLLETPKAPRRVRCGRGCPPPAGEGLKKGPDHFPENVLLFDLKS